MRQISKLNKSKCVIITFLTVMGTEKKENTAVFEFLWGAKKK